MENILILPGIKSRLHYTKEAPNDYHPLNREFNVDRIKWILYDKPKGSGKSIFARHIYITSNETIKKGDYFIENEKIIKWKMTYSLPSEMADVCKKIIITDDQNLIIDGVQEIDYNFLKWFIKNPTCKEVKIESEYLDIIADNYYKIITPKENYKQETFEKAIKRFSGEGGWQCPMSFEEGIKWQAERSYSEEEAGELVYNIIGQYAKQYGIMIDDVKLNDLFEQFKKKQQ